MSENVPTAVHEILKKIQGDIIWANSSETETRFERLEALVREQRHEGAAMLIMSARPPAISRSVSPPPNSKSRCSTRAISEYPDRSLPDEIFLNVLPVLQLTLAVCAT
jgi:hypothetical protein